MIELTFIEHSGAEHTVSADAGTNVMQAAIDNGVPGIDADCGGACACGTCHVMVSTEWLDKVGSASDIEITMLEMTPEKNERSRLACQISLSPELSGLVVNLPEFQM
ncbi:2Fe-2S iron-sulfur cluster binding domain-containing protein [Spongiibacter sp. KMU-158]|uniref:2Fe-2S iron-sulfur cluster binding domain-containing protein n=1 Tax=Spongiibacter pelagi TaxID=2760804 RepID=A0A927C192_9GAMM|nr:2Fe-2S iron-sulfur cluster-binding protein [Spongiibacter pelagi]MBD2859410.1 2Fe-2S iron-sulfur cluster binding domain-containing protein [Spongiibacter pelagi]